MACKFSTMEKIRSSRIIVRDGHCKNIHSCMYCPVRGGLTSGGFIVCKVDISGNSRGIDDTTSRDAIKIAKRYLSRFKVEHILGALL